MTERQLVILGGGAAGLSAAVEAKKNGIGDVLVIERNSCFGGVLRQCIHDGFGLHKYKENLTGVEFAERVTQDAIRAGVEFLPDTFVVDFHDRILTLVSKTEGLMQIQAEAVILAMGCRERPRGSLLIPGSRCAGILTAGTAQKLLNLEGYLPGKRAVILGSGDIGLIMARQLTVEGVKVEHVVEIMPYSSGLARNMLQCVEDFDIPVSYNCTVTQIKGTKRVEAVTVARVDEKRRVLPGTEWEIPCDCLILSVGLIPENELSNRADLEISPSTKGATVDDLLMTTAEGVFACGNVLHVHDLVDFVAEEGERAGRSAAEYLKNRPAATECIFVREGAGVGGIVPQRIRTEGSGKIRFMFRPKERIRDARVCIYRNEERTAVIPKRILTPGEMCSFDVEREKLSGASDILVCVEKGDR